jgi:hypothetical protein
MIVLAAMAAASPAAALADTPRELLTVAAFQAPDKTRALALVAQAIAASDRILAKRAGDHEATLQRGIAIGYRGKLTRSRGDVKASLVIFERLAAQNPRDAEVQMAIAGWHLGAIDQLGSFLARTALGAKAAVGETALDRAVALGGDRAFYPGLGALLHIRNDHADVAQARKWAEAAAGAQTPTTLDAVMKRAAVSLLPALRANDGKAAAAQARRLLPFGKLGD